jgi:hypothetical protein
MTTFSTQPVGQPAEGGARSILATLLQWWTQWRDLEQDVAVYCQSSHDKLIYATLGTVCALLLCAWLFWRLRLF